MRQILPKPKNVVVGEGAFYAIEELVYTFFGIGDRYNPYPFL